MADFAFNIALGKASEYGARVNADDPANSVFVILVLATTGIEADATLKDADTVTALVAGTTNEVTNGSYARKSINQAGGLTVTVNDTNDRIELDMPDQTWTTVAAGDGWNDVVFAFDSDSTAGTDANIVPISQHDFVLTPDGSDITMQIGANGFYWST